MKSQVQPQFNEWLIMMEKAFEILSTEEFTELENRIKKEIAASRRKRKK